MQALLSGLALALGGLGLLVGPLQAAPDPHAGHQVGHQAPQDAPVRFVDAMLIDQHERPVLLQDEVADRIVVMGFIYTSCTTVCPVVSAIMQKVQERLGGRVGDDVRLISISIDPLRDTPARLRDQARTYQAGPGWIWLTGAVPAVTDTLKGLGTWSADLQNHQPVILVGDGRSGRWTRYYGFTDPAVLVARVAELSAARGHEHAHEHLSHQTATGRGERP